MQHATPPIPGSDGLVSVFVGQSVRQFLCTQQPWVCSYPLHAGDLPSSYWQSWVKRDVHLLWVFVHALEFRFFFAAVPGLCEDCTSGSLLFGSVTVGQWSGL